MKKLISIVVLLLGIATIASAEYVRGHMRKDGSYVNGYYRTERDNNPYNNQSMPGNFNYNTGRVTQGDRSEYLNNHYAPKVETFEIPTLDNIGGHKNSVNDDFW